MEKSEREAREKILALVREYAEKYHKNDKPFEEGDRINYAGRVYDGAEMANLVDSALDFWLTAGRYANMFEERMAEYLKVKNVFLVNSGSSANLLAFYALTCAELGERRIRRGDEVITVAASFPTTVAPIVQYGAVPVFVDVEIPSYNIDTSLLEGALSEKTKAVMIAHTLGNPFDICGVKEFCDRHSLWLIEDNCDALGSEYTLNGQTSLTGTFGDIGTSSFYPPHHMTMGEGGAVYTNNPLLAKCIRSLRDWGRDCVCPSGADNFCGHRFDRQFGMLPKGYDHKYVYSHFGFNLKATEMQAAIGVAQLEKLNGFTKKRRENFARLRKALAPVSDRLILPEASPSANPSWFGFIMTCAEGVERENVTACLEEKHIQTRVLFSGNITLHPCFDEMREKNEGYRIAGSLKNTDRIMRDTFWVGVYPAMTAEKIDYMAKSIIGALT